MKYVMNKNSTVEKDPVFPSSSSSHPPAPDLSMDQYDRFLRQARLFDMGGTLRGEALRREGPRTRFCIPAAHSK